MGGAALDFSRLLILILSLTPTRNLPHYSHEREIKTRFLYYLRCFGLFSSPHLLCLPNSNYDSNCDFNYDSN